MYLMNDVKISLDRYSRMINAPKNEIAKVLKALRIKPVKKGVYNFNDIAEVSNKILPPMPVSKKVISFFIAKGGTGKTSNTYNLAMYLGLLGFKVLLVDIDEQCNLSEQCGFGIDDLLELERTSFTIFENNDSILDTTVAVATNVDLIPGDSRMPTVGTLLQNRPGSDLIIRNKFEDEGILDKYDYVIVDNNSSPDKASNNFFLVSDCVISSAQPKSNCFSGIDPVIQTVEMVSSATRRPIDYRILMNFMDKTPDSKRWFQAYKENFSDYMFSSVIRKSNDFPNSETGKQPFFSFASERSNALTDYAEFIDEFIDLTAGDESVATATASERELR